MGFNNPPNSRQGVVAGVDTGAATTGPGVRMYQDAASNKGVVEWRDGVTGDPVRTLSLDSKNNLAFDGPVSAPALIQASFVTITPVANTPTTLQVTFATAFANIPAVTVSASTNSPGTSVLEVSVSTVTRTGFLVVIDRASTTPTGIYWIATAQTQ